MNYYYTTNAGVRKSIPSALVYQCKDGVLDGPFEQRRVTLGGDLNTREDMNIERGRYTRGNRTGTWTVNGVSEGGQATLFTENYKDDAVVGVSRTTEGGKLIEVECSSRLPARSWQFWRVKLNKATPEKVALAERAALACEDWNTAICEDFKQQGLFGNEVSCQCANHCSNPDTCTLMHGQCVEPRSDVDCGKSIACLTMGKCGFDGSSCVVNGDEDCARSTGCAENGLCAEKAGKCVAAADNGCAASLACKKEKRCKASSSECVVAPGLSQACTDDDCAEGQSISGQSVFEQNDQPVVLGERRSPALFGLGIAVTIVGGAAVLGGVGGFMYYERQASEDFTTIQKVAFTATATAGLGAFVFLGLPMIRVYGERLPVKPPKAATMSILPVIGPTWVGLHGQF